MAFSLTIAGSAKDLKAGSLNINKTANGRATASFTVVSPDGSYRPAFDAVVVVTGLDGVTVEFAGLVQVVSEKGLFNGARPAFETQISAADYHQYADRVNVMDGGFPAGYTMLQVATALLGSLQEVDPAVTLDPGQVTGPALTGELVYKGKSVTDILSEYVTVASTDTTKYQWRITSAKVFSIYAVGSEAAPFNILTNTPSQVIGDIAVESDRKHYANKVWIKTPTKNETARVETFTGDGSTSSFTLQYTRTNSYGTVGLTSNPNETLNFTGDSNAATWTYDQTTNTITRNATNPDGTVAGPPAIGETVSFKFDGTYTGLTSASDAGEIAAHGLWEKIVTVEDVPDDTTLQALADAYLASSLPITRTVKYRTSTAGLAPGQTQTITVPRRGIDVEGVITDVVVRDFGKAALLRDVTVLVDAQSNIGRGWRDVYKQWSGDKSGTGGATTTAGAGAPTSTGPGGADKNVQFNKAGVFGGKSEFSYDYTNNNIWCGGGTTAVTSTDADSCGAFGYNCHIAD